MSELASAHNDMITLKKRICFVVGQMKFIGIRMEGDSTPLYHFMPVLDRLVIWEAEFTKAHEGKKTS